VRRESRGSHANHVKRSRGCALQESSLSGSSSSSNISWSSGSSLTSSSNIRWANRTEHSKPGTVVEMAEAVEEVEHMETRATGSDVAAEPSVHEEEEECISSAQVRGGRKRCDEGPGEGNRTEGDQRDEKPHEDFVRC
jgi:hypothetical protein